MSPSEHMTHVMPACLHMFLCVSPFLIPPPPPPSWVHLQTCVDGSSQILSDCAGSEYSECQRRQMNVTSPLYAHVYISMHACMCNYVHECAHTRKGQETTSVSFLKGQPPFSVFVQGLSAAWNLPTRRPYFVKVLLLQEEGPTPKSCPLTST